MAILVTGGCGFIGSNFIHYFLEKYPAADVVNLDKLTYAGNPDNLEGLRPDLKDRYTFVRGDIADIDLVSRLLREYAVRVVVNFAAETHVDRSIDDPSAFITTNIQGTYNLMECARKMDIHKFVHISTDEVYGSLGPSGEFTEDTPLAPNSPYSASKAAADLMARSYYKTYGFPVIITRCSNNYGPYQFPEKLIPLAYLRAVQDRPVPVYGRGENIRDWIFVRDHCRGIALSMEKGRPGAVYNFGGDAEKKNIDVVRSVLDFAGKSHELITFVQDRPGHDLRYAMDYSLARSELGWEPRTTFVDGLAETLTWYKNNRQWVAKVQRGEYQQFMDKWYKERC
ncbi:MAG: dTDP-glucose 4,6-dehydratase [Desulfonatronovibrionaceae bacterium]